MSFSILTNTASLQAQQYLNANQAFQSKTIQQVTSGLRIVNSGDDAAGLAIANGDRSTEAVLTQGVLNANDGLSQLQIVDGGINNISQLLDRASTLATQSASGTFTGNRGVLDSEFQSVVGEINREAQSIGLSKGGSLAQNLQVFIGGGQANSGISAINNGSVSLNLGQSTVDAQSLGLTGVQAIGAAGTDIGAGSANTSLSAILGNAANSGSTSTPGFTNFILKGPGFAGNGVSIQVNTANLGGTSDLVSAVNAAIQGASNAGTQAATALKNAGITASINTDSAGKQQLVFSSSTSAFQVQAGDRQANALLGNFAQNAVATGTDNNATVNTSTNNALTFKVDGGTAFTVNVTQGAATSKGQIVSDLNAYFKTNSIGATASLNGNQLVIGSNNTGSSSAITFTGTALSSALGLTSATAASASTGAAVTTTVQGQSAVAAGANLIGTDAGQTASILAANNTLVLTAGNSGAQTLTLSGNGTETKAQIAADINTQIANNGNFTAANGAQVAASVVNNQIVLTATTSGSAVTLGAGTANAALGFTTGETSTVHTATSSDTIHLRFQGSGLTSPVDVALNPITAGTTTSANVLADLQSQIAGNSALQAAGITLSTSSLGNNLVFTSSNGGQFQVSSTGDSQNLLGLGAFVAGSGNNVTDYNSITAGSSYSTGLAGGAGPATLEVSLNGLASSGNQIAVNLSGPGTDAVAAQLATTAADNGAATAVAGAQTGTTVAATFSAATSGAEAGSVAQTGGAVATSGLQTGTAAQSAVVAASAGAQTGTVAQNGSNEFDLSGGTTGNLDLKVDGGSTISVSLGNSATATAVSITGAINTALGYSGATIDGSGHLVITSSTTGASSSVQVLGSSDAGTLTALGLTASTQSGAAATNGFDLSGSAGSGAALNLKIDGGSTIAVTLGNSATESSTSLLHTINTALGSAGSATINGSGKLVITSATTGASSSVQVLGSSDSGLLTALGLSASTQSGTAFSSGTFDLSGSSGSTAALQLSIDGGSAVKVTLGNSGTASATSLLNSINAAIGSAGTASIDGSGDLKITSATTGATSSVQVLGTSDAGLVTALGLSTTKQSGAAAVKGFDLSGSAGSGAALDVKIDGGSTVSVTLGNSATESTTSLLSAINTAIGTAGTASIDSSGHLSITSATSGASSSLQVVNTSDSGLLTALGLSASTVTGSAGAGGGIDLSGAASSGSQLKLVVDGTHAVNVTLGNSSSVSALQIASEIGTALGSYGTASVDSSGHVVIKSASTGADSSIDVLGTSDAGLTTALGLTPATTTRGTNASEANVINQINTAIAGNSSLTNAGLQALDNGHGAITLQSNNNTFFRVNSFGAGDIGFGNSGTSFTGNTQSAAPLTSQYVDSQGATATGDLKYTDTLYGSDNQTIAVTGSDSAGGKHSIGITLQNNASGRQQTIDQAINQINTQLQQSNDPTLQSIVAVKDDSNGVQSIRFLSTLSNFQVSVGADAGGTGIQPPAGNVANATTLGTGLTASVGTQSNAEAAVGALANAVTLLGNAQAVVGRGENQFNYAVNLAQSQLTNISAAESGIRDADLASAAANLTKAQILVQAGVAALAQANSAPQQILSLLKG